MEKKKLVLGNKVRVVDMEKPSHFNYVVKALDWEWKVIDTSYFFYCIAATEAAEGLLHEDGVCEVTISKTCKPPEGE